MEEMTFSDLFEKFHGIGHFPTPAIAWDGGTKFAYIEHLFLGKHNLENDSADAHSWELIKISDLVKNNNSSDDIISRYIIAHPTHLDTASCNDFKSFLISLFSTTSEQGFCIWGEDSSRHSFAITPNSDSESERWNHQPEGWDEWVGMGYGPHVKPKTEYLGRCSPN